MGGGGGGGGGWNPVKDISNGIGNLSHNINSVGNFIGGDVGKAINAGNNFAVGNMLPGGPITGAYMGINNYKVDDRPEPPKAPGVDSGAAAMHQAQIDQARSFRKNLGANEDQAYQNFAKAQQGSMNKNLSAVNQANNARGLLYGGVNQGQQQALRAQGQVQLARGKASINDQYNQAANQMDATAVGSGVAVQQYQQGIQDQIYNQALMNMMNQNQAFGSLLGAGGMAAAMALA